LPRRLAAQLRGGLDVARVQPRSILTLELDAATHRFAATDAGRGRVADLGAREVRDLGHEREAVPRGLRVRRARRAALQSCGGLDAVAREVLIVVGQAELLEDPVTEGVQIRHLRFAAVHGQAGGGDDGGKVVVEGRDVVRDVEVGPAGVSIVEAHVEVEGRAVDDRHDRARLGQRLREGVVLVLDREGPLELVVCRRAVLAQEEAGDIEGLVEPALVEPHPVRVDRPDDGEAKAQTLGKVRLDEQAQEMAEDEAADLLLGMRHADQRRAQWAAAELQTAQSMSAARGPRIPHADLGVRREEAVSRRLHLVKGEEALVRRHGGDDLIVTWVHPDTLFGRPWYASAADVPRVGSCTVHPLR